MLHRALGMLHLVALQSYPLASQLYFSPLAEGEITFTHMHMQAPLDVTLAAEMVVCHGVGKDRDY